MLLKNLFYLSLNLDLQEITVGMELGREKGARKMPPRTATISPCIA